MADKRRFLIEIMSDTDDGVAGINRVTAALTEMQAAASKSAAAQTAAGAAAGGASDAVKKKLRGGNDAFLKDAAILAGAWYGVKGALNSTVGAASELEDQISRVDRVIADAGGNAEQMADEFLKAGKNAGALVTASAEFVKIGARGPAQLKEMAVLAGQFGKITGMSTEAAASSLVRLAQSLGLSADGVAELAGGMALLHKTTGVEVGQLQRFVAMLGPVAQDAGLSTAAILGLSAVLGRMGGRQGMLASRGLTQIMSQLRESPEELANAIGITSEQLEQMIEDQPEEVFNRLFATINASGKDAKDVLEDLGIKGIPAVSAFKQLAKQADQVSKSIGTAAAGMKDHNTIATLYAEEMGRLSESYKRLKTVMGDLWLRVGKKLLPIIKGIVDTLADFVDTISQLPDWLLTTAATLLGVAAAVTVTAFAVNKLGGYVTKLVGPVKALIKLMPGGQGLLGMLGAAFANPVVLAIGIVIAAIVAAFVLVPKLIKMLESTDEKTRRWGKALMLLFHPLVMLYTVVKTLWTILKPLFDFVIDVGLMILETVLDPFIMLFDVLTESVFGTAMSFKEWFGWVDDVAKTFKLALMPVLMAVKAFMPVLRRAIVTFIVEAYGAFLHFYNVLAKVTNKILDLFDMMLDKWESVTSLIPNVVNTAAATLPILEAGLKNSLPLWMQNAWDIGKMGGKAIFGAGGAGGPGMSGQTGGGGGAGGAGGEPISYMPKDKMAVEVSAAPSTFSAPSVTNNIVVHLDGREISAIIEERQALSRTRSFNAPSTAMRGIEA